MKKSLKNSVDVEVRIQSFQYDDSIFLGYENTFVPLLKNASDETKICWKFVYVPDHAGTFGTGVLYTCSKGFHWHYDSSKQQIILEENASKTSFAEDSSNLFRIENPQPPYYIKPHTNPKMYVQFDPKITEAMLPVTALSHANHIAFSVAATRNN